MGVAALGVGAGVIGDDDEGAAVGEGDTGVGASVVELGFGVAAVGDGELGCDPPSHHRLADHCLHVPSSATA